MSTAKANAATAGVAPKAAEAKVTTPDPPAAAATADVGNKTKESASDPDEIVLAHGGVRKKILKEGEGTDTPTEGSDVSVHYTGTLMDGTKFDSSRDRNTPFTFKLGRGQVIKGWDEGVSSMRKGERAVLTCRPDYAYGATGSEPKIPPNATLKFDVELLSWTKKQKVTDDGRVMKEIVKAGEGYNRPNDGAKVKVKYTAKVVGGEKFIDHWDKEVELVLGDDPKIPEGFEESIKNLYQGEHAKFWVDPHYGYGREGSPELKVPRLAHLQYEILLVSFEKGKETYEMSTEEKLVFAQAKKKQGNEFFKLGQVDRAAKKYTAIVNTFRYEKQFSDEQQKTVKELRVAAHSNLAVCKHKKGDEEDAVFTECTEALKLDPDHVKCLYRRAAIHAKRGDFDKAKEDLHHARGFDAKNKEVEALYQTVAKRIADQTRKERDLFRGMFNRVKLVTDKEDGGATAGSSSEENGENKKKQAARKKKRAAAAPVDKTSDDTKSKQEASPTTPAATTAPGVPAATATTSPPVTTTAASASVTATAAPPAADTKKSAS